MDWNWFFSSLSQSSAAIVGLFGAFIVTKILSNQAQFGERTARFKALQAAASKLAGSANNLAFAWYVRLSKGSQIEGAEDLLDKNADLSPEDLYVRLRFPPFLAREDALQALEAVKARREREAEAERKRYQTAAEQHAARRSKLGTLGGLAPIAGLSGDAFAYPVPQNISRPTAFHPHAELEREREAIDALEVEIRHHIRTVSDFLETVSSNPESSAAISWALAMVALLFLVGVVYPLSFLPTPVPWKPALELRGFWEHALSLRGMLLIFISAIFLAALAMFAVMNRRMRYSLDDIRSLESYVRIETYSKYYAIADENRKASRERAQAA